MLFNPKKKKKKKKEKKKNEILEDDKELEKEENEEGEGFPTKAEIFFGTSCPKTELLKIYITPKVIPPVLSLMKKFPRTEWIMLLLGEYDDKKFIYRITDYYIPEQKVTRISAEITQNSYPFDPDKIVGSIHSHHEMHIGASSTDVRMSYPLLLIIRERTTEKAALVIENYEIIAYVRIPLYECMKKFAYLMFQTENLFIEGKERFQTENLFLKGEEISEEELKRIRIS